MTETEYRLGFENFVLVETWCLNIHKIKVSPLKNVGEVCLSVPCTLGGLPFCVACNSVSPSHLHPPVVARVLTVVLLPDEGLSKS